MTNIEFNNDLDISETSLVGYLYPNELLKSDFYKKLKYKIPQNEYDETLKICTLSFEEVIARLYNLTNIDIFNEGDSYKSSFQIIGKYKNRIFTLYDYKEDMCIHIGGQENLELDGLRKELDLMIMSNEPKPFTTKCHYSEFLHYKFS